MRVCSICKQSKDIEDFNKNKTRRDGLQTVCRPCNSAKSKQYYAENKEKHFQSVHARKLKTIKQNRNLLVEYFKTHPCIDCGYSDFRALEFDHVIGQKINGVGKLISLGYSWTKIKQEIAKCEVRCKNCHAIVTSQRGNWWSDTSLRNSEEE